ncbi:putative baseplate assembly protein [Cyanobacteria bacterium FACHB-63]|nr:putative baseplate assembly protein [Cyanobacteria bacterium FACHB-63]
MEFNFLPKLPSPNLDDRTFTDLVDECTLRIPRYCPEWTDHNLSDPGITLIELFAWLTDQTLMRFNQVPRKNYIAFLELLGIRLQPPRPAQVDLTFYLSSDLEESYVLPTGIEVSSAQTEQQNAVVFSTDQPLIISKPKLQHFLIDRTSEPVPQRLRDPVTNEWSRQNEEDWNGREQALFDEQPQPGNCFYLVFDADTPLDGNVLAIRFKGAAGTPTGIDPNRPPRRWEAWDGETWRSILLKEADDQTQGFSFHELEQQGNNPTQGADVILHLPQSWKSASFTGYRGRWLRCVLTNPPSTQRGYASSPRITGIQVRSIGGTVAASQCNVIENERLGISNGDPGQAFQLQNAPILERQSNEYILVEPPNALAQRWEEKPDFADSTPRSRHYTIDSLAGTIQFGPLIREPNSLRYQTQKRAQVQTARQTTEVHIEGLEHQYGAIPPVGSEIRIVRYRTGGGREGNVQAQTVRFLRSAVPYVDRVTNHQAAVNGSDAESLEQAVLRATRFLRTRDRAVTAEDFETLTQQAGSVARVQCLTPPESGSPGTVRLLVVPQANLDTIDQGIAPEQFALNPALRSRILNYLDDRRLLGIQVQLAEPEYVGVCVQTQVGLEPTYDHPQAQQVVLANLKTALYRYLNPLTGGLEEQGWMFGRPLYQSDIVALLQQAPGVRFIGPVTLFAIRKQSDGTWRRESAPEPLIDPGRLGLICSWHNNSLRSSHVVNLINP